MRFNFFQQAECVNRRWILLIVHHPARLCEIRCWCNQL
ncbi:hypothetical protein EC971742_5103, partial [Escherichia coli 97.1742]